MTTFQMQARTEYPVLFLSDPASMEAIPGDTGQSFVTATDSCICFWVQSYVDGMSTVILTDAECDRAGIKLFSGSLATPSGVMSLSDSGSFRYINVPVSVGRISVDIWSDDDRYPGWVWIKLTEISVG
ncbi:hypothetical protein [Inquilinus limosus]|uniref:hypothetical protein n=1 Tax=Inquilinus limosus TaxID=171674 RepID=UPI00126A3233|nr:hypothetical protein [Inquilinus limosus]